MKNINKKLPAFKSLEEEANFWNTHNVIDLTPISKKELKEIGIHPDYSVKGEPKEKRYGNV